MIILDTNVVSALMREIPERTLVSWLDQRPRSSIWTTSITVMEIQFGLQILPVGHRRELMTKSFEVMMERKIEERIASFDRAAAGCAAELMASRRNKGRPVELKDTMIAGIVLSTNAVLATKNIAHFSDLGSRVIDPWIQPG